MPITIRTASQHEALVLRLEALGRQVGALAARQPGLAVANDLRALAEDLLHQCRPFMRGIGALPPAAPSYGGLGGQLSEARARLEAFELRHTSWDAVRKCRVWGLASGEWRAVERLAPQPVAPPPKSAQATRRTQANRLAVIRLIDGRYDEGYDDALAGRPRSHRRDRFNRDGSEKPWG